MSENKTAARDDLVSDIARDTARNGFCEGAGDASRELVEKHIAHPHFDATKLPTEVSALMDDGATLSSNNHFRLDGSEMGKIFQGLAPSPPLTRWRPWTIRRL